MKKIFTLFAAALMAVGMFAGSYGILVNGTTYFPATSEGPDPYGEGFDQYLAHVQLKNGDFCQLCDADNRAVWAVDLNTSSVNGFTRDGDKYNVSVTGCFDFYIKLKYQADQLYIGEGSNCGEGIDISSGGGGEGGDPSGYEFYAMGWINGADAGESAYTDFDENLKFVDGKLYLNCTMGSYIAVKDDDGNTYYSKTETTIENTKVTLDWANGWSGCQKWAIPQGENYIIIRKLSFKGQIELERVDKATFDAYHLGNAVEDVRVDAQVIKTVENGQVVIIKNGVRYNLLGAELR